MNLPQKDHSFQQPWTCFVVLCQIKQPWTHYVQALKITHLCGRNIAVVSRQRMVMSRINMCLRTQHILLGSIYNRLVHTGLGAGQPARETGLLTSDVDGFQKALRSTVIPTCIVRLLLGTFNVRLIGCSIAALLALLRALPASCLKTRICPEKSILRAAPLKSSWRYGSPSLAPLRPLAR